MRFGRVLAASLGFLLFFALVGAAAAVALQNTGVAPGAMEPPPVDPGSGVSSSIWDKLTSGGWASDLYIDTPGFGTSTPSITRC